MQKLKERIRSRERLENPRYSEEPISPRERDEKGRIRTPRSGGPSREASPRELSGEKSPHRSYRRDSDQTFKEKSREQTKSPAAVTPVTEGSDELVNVGKSPTGLRDVFDKFQGKALLVAKADLLEQLFCWGEGYGTSPVSIQPKDVRNIICVSSGPMHSVAVTDSGAIYAWGKNASGQLGTGNTESLDAPTPVAFFSDYKVKSVACGGAQTLVLTEPSEVYQFGYDGFHSHKLPVLVEPSFASLSNRKVAMVSAGPTHSALVTELGELYTWGQGSKGQLGYDADKKERPSHVERFLYKPIRYVSCGTTHTCIITERNKLWVFGEFIPGSDLRKPHKISPAVQPDGAMQWRHSSKLKRVTSSLIQHNSTPPKFIGVHSVVCGMHFTLFVTDEGEVWAFGANRHGELGQGNLEPSDHPKRIEALKEPVVTIGCGQTHVLATTASAELWGWGGTAHQVLGAHASAEYVLAPTRIKTLRGKLPVRVCGSSSASVAVMKQGLFGAPFSDLVKQGDLPHRLSAILTCLELDEHIGHNQVIQSHGFSAEKRKLQLLLDQGAEINLGEYSLNTVASTLQTFFKETPDCLLSSRQFSTFIKAAEEASDLQRIEALRAAILRLPRENVTLLSRLLSFFRKALNKGSLSASLIASVYGPLILREPVQLAGPDLSAPISAKVVQVVTLIIELDSMVLQRDPVEVLNILLKNDIAAQRPRREIWSGWVGNLDKKGFRLHSGNSSQPYADVLLSSNAPRYFLESIMDRCFPAETEDLRLFVHYVALLHLTRHLQTRLVQVMYHVEVEQERLMGALRQLSLATLSPQQRETMVNLFLSFKRSSAEQLEDVSKEMEKIIAMKELEDRLDESLRDSHKLIVTLTTMREILKKEHIARLSVIHTNSVRIQSLVSDASMQLQQLETETSEQEKRLQKIVTKELLQLNDISERTSELTQKERVLSARKVALEAELARVNEELLGMRTQLQSFNAQRDEAVHEKEEDTAKDMLERTRLSLQSQRVFKEALMSCNMYNEKLTQAFQAEEKNLQKRLDDTTTQCVQSLMLHLELIEQVFQTMMEKLRKANAMLGDAMQQPRYIVREYNKEKLVFEQFSAGYEDFKAGALPLLESLEKERSAEIAETFTELDRFRERIARSFSEIA